ncbi:MAG: transporter [Nocardia sp.]|uniref:hypothetical protein n=1 Tax=Nocardia sp. TaxID=1821 RepID=UPI00260640DE|nr:hypothetical protein [Nocardia sp.]MCU1640400.1 transporter [Nocardia sp.]
MFVGVPLGTLIGQQFGWRITFGFVALLGVAGLFGIAKLVPDLPAPEGVRLRRELAAFKNIQVLLANGMTVLGFGAEFAAITYIAPMMTEIVGNADSSITWLLELALVSGAPRNCLGRRRARCGARGSRSLTVRYRPEFSR